jgi:hypothetical protein
VSETKPHTGEGTATFRDLAGRTWRIKINVASLRMLRSDQDLDLLKILDREKTPLAQLADDPFRLCDVLWALIKGQAAEAAVAELDWLESMAGDVLSEAAYALMEATIDFFPQHRREPLAAMLKKMKTAEAALTKRMTHLAESETVDQAINQELEKAETMAAEKLRTLLTRPGT